MLWVGTASGIFSFERADGAWAPAGRHLEDRAIVGIAVQADGERIVAAARHDGLYESADGGASWRIVAEDIDPWTVASAPDGSVYAGVEPAGVYRRRPGEEAFRDCAMVRTLPSYRTWCFPQAPFNGNIRSFAFSKSSPGTVYAGVEVGGVLRSDDHGETWRESREGLHIDVHVVETAQGSEDIVYAATGRGIYRTLDGGVSWEAACEGLKGLYGEALAVDPRNPQLVVAAVAQGRPRYARNRAEGTMVSFYRSADGASTWEPIMGGLPETLTPSVRAMIVDAEANAIVAGTSDGQVLVGHALGDSWTVAAEGLSPVHTLTVA